MPPYNSGSIAGFRCWCSRQRIQNKCKVYGRVQVLARACAPEKTQHTPEQARVAERLVQELGPCADQENALDHLGCCTDVSRRSLDPKVVTDNVWDDLGCLRAWGRNALTTLERGEGEVAHLLSI